MLEDEDLCQRRAKQGYFAIAPEIYVRQGDPRRHIDIGGLPKALVSCVPDETVMTDFDACAAYADRHARANAANIAITGFCHGGRVVWLYTAQLPRVKAGVAWYGRLVGATSAISPRHPVGVAAQLHAPVLGLHGGADSGIPLDTVEKMRAALKAAGKDASSSIHVYPGTATYPFSSYTTSGDTNWLIGLLPLSG